MKTRFFYIVIFLLTSTNLVSQSLNSFVEESESLIKNTQIKLQFPSTDNSALSLFKNLKIKKTKNLNLLQIDLKELQSNQYKKDVGFVFKANADYNFRATIDEETNATIKTRVRAELEWNLLKMGYVYNRIKSKRLQNDIEILKLESSNTEKQLWRRQFRIDYNYVLNKEVLKHSEDFLFFENSYFDFLNKLYYQKLIKREQLIKVSNQIIVIENQIKTLKKENRVLKDSVSSKYLNLKKLPLLVVKLDSFSLYKISEKKQFKEENIRLQHHPLNDLNFSLYVNQNYTYSETTQRSFPSVGFRFRAPIRFNNRKKIIATKIKILHAQETDKSLGKFNLAITYLNEYNEKLKDLQNQYKSWQIIAERIRVLKALKQELKYQNTGTLILELLEEQFKVLENTFQLKRQLYKVITRFYELNSSANIHTLFTTFQFKETMHKKEFVLKRSSAYSIDFQIKFLKAKQIKNVVLFTNDNSIISKLKKASIGYKVQEKSSINSVEKFINDELNILKKQQNENI